LRQTLVLPILIDLWSLRQVILLNIQDLERTLSMQPFHRRHVFFPCRLCLLQEIIQDLLFQRPDILMGLFLCNILHLFSLGRLSHLNCHIIDPVPHHWDLRFLKV